MRSVGPSRLHALDALRGVAALAVVFWHWNHFFLKGTGHQVVDMSDMPFYAYAAIFYNHGWLAVDLFFCLSGFIFFWLYGDRVSSRSISVGSFALLRFSRLYPLHLLTFIIVGVAQVYYTNVAGNAFVYVNSNIKHAVLNILFVSAWGIQDGLSFNGPIWSVSVEVLLYVLFFIYCRIQRPLLVSMIIISIIEYCIIYRYNPEVGRGVGSFFLGGLVYLFYRYISLHTWRIWSGTIVEILVIVLWSITLVVYYNGFNVVDNIHDVLPVWLQKSDRFEWLLIKFVSRWPIIVLFPFTVLALALAETRGGKLWSKLAFLGNISYSVYLMHFPLQLLVMIVANGINAPEEIFKSVWFMLSFYVALITLSAMSYKWFEMPAQRVIRNMRVAKQL